MSDRETLADKNHEGRSKKTYKRRSSIFQVTRRLEDLEIPKHKDDEDREEKNENPSSEEPLDLRAYIESLRNERKAWKETLRERKSRRRKLEEEKSISEKEGVAHDLDILSESERSFVLARPPYREIAKRINNLTEDAIKVATLGLEINNMKDRLTLMMEAKVVDMTKKIIKMSSEET